MMLFFLLIGDFNPGLFNLNNGCINTINRLLWKTSDK